MMSLRLRRRLARLGLVVALAVTAWDLALTVRGREISYLTSSVFDALWAIGFFAFGLVAWVILERLPRQRIGWILMWTSVLMSIELLLARIGENALDLDRTAFDDRLAWVTNWLWIPPLILLTVHLPLYFPSGSAPSRRWRPVGWIGGIGIAVTLLAAALREGPLDDPFSTIVNPFGVHGFDPTTQTLAELVWWTAAVGALGAMVIRFHGSAGVERQQIKWLLASLVPGLGLIAIALVWAYTGGAPGQIPTFGLLLVPVWTLGIAVASGVAIFRYRLYDIDALINRALVYGATTALLGASFVAVVLLLQTALRPITGGSEVAVAASTMLTLAAFQPLRARVQRTVDRRFYRSRYDAARTLDAFTTRLRDEVDLDQLRTDLLDVIGNTVRPAHAGVWIREMPQ